MRVEEGTKHRLSRGVQLPREGVGSVIVQRGRGKCSRFLQTSRLGSTTTSHLYSLLKLLLCNYCWAWWHDTHGSSAALPLWLPVAVYDICVFVLVLRLASVFTTGLKRAFLWAADSPDLPYLTAEPRVTASKSSLQQLPSFQTAVATAPIGLP